MEVTDVNQLMSWIESGTVSIICDFAQLQESSEDIDNTVLASDETNNAATILNQSLGGSLVIREDDETERTDAINASRSVQDDVEPNQFRSLDQAVEEKRLDKYHSECSQDKSSPQLQLPRRQYFIQMSDGQIIQVLGTLEEDAERDTLPEVPLREGVSEAVPGHVEGTRDGVQILVVGSNSGEEMYLISTPDKNTEDSELRNSVTTDVKSNTLHEDADETTMVQSSNTIMSTLPPNDDGDSLSLSEVEDDNCQKNLMQVPLHIEGTKFESRLLSSKETDKITNLHVESQLCNKDILLSNLPVHKTRKTPKDKQKLPLKIPANSLKEGTLVRTDRGDMVAYNLSSLPQLKEPSGQISKLHVIASMFGPAMKVLRPVESKNEVPSELTCKKFSVFNCKDCSAVLHSERSLQNHQRKYHKDWEEECFICGEKFLNVQYVRSHIQEMHNSEKFFQCRLCSHKCESLKNLFKHHKSHKESRICSYCGKKYITHKLYKKHVISCQERKKSQPCRSACELSLVSNELEGKQNQEKKFVGNENMRYMKKKNEYNENYMNDETVEVCDSSDLSNVRRKLSKTSTDQKIVKNDTEFKFESKHYHKQAKRMAQEQLNQPVQRSSRAGRERTHRCYLCFKLFSTAASLESHKENYHLVKSERPVRVKTDTALDEREELADSNIKEEIASHRNALEEVVIKEEPVELSEDFENITIIVDESVNSPHIIKPFCIACKAYTNIDFRKYSKWFSQVPDDCQSDMLKKFHPFLPCSFDPDSLVEPWILCKKCVILIDRIADMEEKLCLVKNDLLSRVKGNSATHSTAKQNILSSETVREDSQTEIVTSLIKDNIKGIGKDLSDIEAYMKDTCEIMEITKPQKGPGRPKKDMKEKLTPILVEDKYEEESVSDIVKFITHDLVKKEQKNSQADLPVTNKSGLKNENKYLPKATVQSDLNFDNVKVKQEPVQYERDTKNTHSESVPWKAISFTNKNDQFDDVCTELRKRNHTDSHSISTEIIMRNLEVTSETDTQNENFQLKKTFACNDSKSLNYCETSSPEHLPSRKLQDLNVGDDGCDIPDTLNTANPFGTGDAIQDGLGSHNRVEHESSASNDQQHERLSSISPSIENMQTDCQESDIPITKILGKKRAKLQEKRSKMCYKVEEQIRKPWRCRECHKPFSTQRGACDHYAASHKGENFACEYCSISYVRKRDLIGHYNKMHLNIKPYKCKLDECPERFSSHGQLYRHMQSAHNTKKGNTKYECHICNATFAEKRYRDAHLLICLSKSSDSVPHKCPFCLKTFKLARYLQLHMQTVHWLKDEQFFCEICDKVLTDKKNVIIHMKSHMGETKAKCEVCGKEFNRKSYLWTHMRTHTNQRPYKCNYCSKAFNQYSTWKNHERTHTGEKPYKCSMCSANFATSSSLSKHVQYGHYNIRDYECDICKKRFISKAKVEEHIKVHTGEKPFKCHVCNRAFNKKNNLKNHMYVHSTNKKYKCEICGEGFMRKSTIENHILERHKYEFVINSNSEDKDVDVKVSTSQFISVKGIDDVPPEDSYIIVFANEDEELSDPKEMQVTVLAEDGTSSQIGMAKANISAPSNCSEAITSVNSKNNVLSEVILEEGRDSDAITTLIVNDISPSITIPERINTTVNQVMEIDDTSLRLVAAADTTVPI